MVEDEEEKKEEEKLTVEENDKEETWWSFLQLEGESEEPPPEPMKKPTPPDATNTPADAQPTPLFTERTTTKQNEQSTHDDNDKRTNDIRHPAFRYQSQLHDTSAVPRVYQSILDATISLPIRDLYAISPDLQQEAVTHERTSRVPPSTSASNTLSLNDEKSPPPPRSNMQLHFASFRYVLLKDRQNLLCSMKDRKLLSFEQTSPKNWASTSTSIGQC